MRLVGKIGLEVQYEIFPYLLQNPLQYLIKKKKLNLREKTKDKWKWQQVIIVKTYGILGILLN